MAGYCSFVARDKNGKIETVTIRIDTPPIRHLASLKADLKSNYIMAGYGPTEKAAEGMLSSYLGE